MIQASTTNEVTMWQRGGPHCLCIVEGQCSASPVIWTWEGEANKEELFNSAGRGTNLPRVEEEKGEGEIRAEPLIPPTFIVRGARMEA